MSKKSKLLGGISGVPLADQVLPEAGPFVPPEGAVQWLGDEAKDMLGNADALAPVRAIVPNHRWDYQLYRGLYLVKHPFKAGRTVTLDPGDWIVPAGTVSAEEHLECAGQPVFRVFDANGVERLNTLEINQA